MEKGQQKGIVEIILLISKIVAMPIYVSRSIQEKAKCVLNSEKD